MAVFSGNGSNTAPSFTFSSDTDTGFFRSADGRAAFTTNGSTSMFFGSGLTIGDQPNDGFSNLEYKVGLYGNNQPARGLILKHVTTTAAAGNAFLGGIVQSTDSGGTPTVSLVNTDNSLAGAQTFSPFISGVTGGAARYINFFGGGSTSPAMRLEANGDLKIGGTLPSSPNIQLAAAGFGYFNGGTIRLGTSVYTSAYNGSCTDSTGSDVRFEVQITFPETSSFDNPFTVEVLAAHPLYNGNVVHYKAITCYKSVNSVVNNAIISENNTNTLTISDSSAGGNRTVAYNSRRPISNTGTAVNCTVYVIVTGGIVPTSVTITDV